MSTRLQRVANEAQAAHAAGAKPLPAVAIRDFLYARVPPFVLFRSSDRALERQYHLGDEGLRNNPPAPLKYLLAAAGSSVVDVWDEVESNDIARHRTLELNLNARLETRVAPMWKQSNLTIRLTINQGGMLEVNIVELGEKLASTPIEERSDGLRAFLALVCFLVARAEDERPILMIDEAEQNLHIDAQADLVRVLTRELDVPAVIYTTHSPGCLPLDLGRGIRIATRDPEDPRASILENNFWTQSDPGFSRLLFAMGAGAAAFSAFRRAVLCEGAAEMILLPTLIRNATGEELDFQIAFGLSNMQVPGGLGEVALNTVFLVDGDTEGVVKSKKLTRAGFPKTHVLQLPAGAAVEDLVSRKQYLATVDAFTSEVYGATIDRTQLDSAKTIARAVDDLALAHPSIRRKLGHVVIASRLAELGDGLELSTAGKRTLPNLRARIIAAFEKPYTFQTPPEAE